MIDTTQCTLDAALMKTLGANMIRVYHVDPSKNHDGCMKAFSDNGIYTIIDLDTVRTNPPEFVQLEFTMLKRLVLLVLDTN